MKTTTVVKIERFAHDGRGVANLAGKTIFVAGALPQEEVSIRYIKRHAKFDEAEAVEILQASTERVQPLCPHFGICGGCSLQYLSSAQQIQLKQQMLLEQLAHIGKVSPEYILPPLQAQVWGYRHKARLGVRYVAKKQSVLVGFREKRSSFITELTQCPVLHPSVGNKITALRQLFNQLTARQHIAQLEVAIGDDNSALVVRNLVALSDSDTQLLSDFAQEHDIYLYLQPAGMDSVYALYPSDLALDSLSYSLPDELVDFKFAATDFTQVNLSINRLMVQQAMLLLQVQPTDMVMDLFCGLGNFSLPLAKRAKQVLAVEGSADLVARAEQNATRQNINNIKYLVADLTQAKNVVEAAQYNKILLDPPRSGALEIIQAIDFSGIDVLVYVSCNPATLARDAGILVHEKNMRLITVGVLDMFPHTAHVESMALFSFA